VEAMIVATMELDDLLKKHEDLSRRAAELRRYL
jgi:hypothetical protein